MGAEPGGKRVAQWGRGQRGAWPQLNQSGEGAGLGAGPGGGLPGGRSPGGGRRRSDGQQNPGGAWGGAAPPNCRCGTAQCWDPAGGEGLRWGGRRLPRYPKMGQRPPASPPHWVGLNPEPHQRWGRAVPPMLYGGAKGLDGGTNLGGGGFLPLRGGRQGPRWGGSAGPSPWEDLNGTGGVKCCCSPPPLRSPPVEGSQPHPCGEGSPPHRRCPRLRGGAGPPAPGAPWTDPALTSSHGCSCGTLSSWGGGETSRGGPERWGGDYFGEGAGGGSLTGGAYCSRWKLALHRGPELSGPGGSLGLLESGAGGGEGGSGC